jgi:hypothetical protein
MPRCLRTGSETTISILRINTAAQRANLGSFVIVVAKLFNLRALPAGLGCSICRRKFPCGKEFFAAAIRTSNA